MQLAVGDDNNGRRDAVRAQRTLWEELITEAEWDLLCGANNKCAACKEGHVGGFGAIRESRPRREAR